MTWYEILYASHAECGHFQYTYVLTLDSRLETWIPKIDARPIIWTSRDYLQSFEPHISNNFNVDLFSEQG